MPKISVIVPVFNTDRYLRRCLDSILNQSLVDIEVVCINDCSTDNSPAILEAYTRNDERVKIITFEENQGVSKARNIGINEALGEYVGFIDSDDYINDCYYESMYIAAQRSNADISKCNRKTIEIDGSQEIMADNAIATDKYKFVSGFTTAIYRKSMLDENGIEFPTGITNHEDIVFLIKAVHWANCVVTVNNAWYYCEKRPDSASHGVAIHKQMLSCVNSINLIIDFLNSVDIPPQAYSAIAFKELMMLCRFGCRNKISETTYYCRQIYAKIKHREKFQLTLPVAFLDYLRSDNEVSLDSFCSILDERQGPPAITFDFLRSKILKNLKKL